MFQDFATLDGLSNGRAEIMAGRGSFIESFPLFGYDLDDYEELFEEKLDLLLKLQQSERVTWSGKHRPSIQDVGVYPRPVQDPLPIWIGSGGNRESVVRAGLLGLPLVLAIIGGDPRQFAPLAQLYKQAAIHAGHDPEKLTVASHSHGFVAEETELAGRSILPFYTACHEYISKRTRLGPYTRSTFDAARTLEGALYVGDPDAVAEKVIHLRKNVGITRFMLHVPVGSMPHDQVLKAIELFGKEVAPKVREEVARWEAEQA
ncbi:LLM class flavin-dependent oxidoreductase [Bacillus sp. 4A_MP2]